MNRRAAAWLAAAVLSAGCAGDPEPAPAPSPARAAPPPAPAAAWFRDVSEEAGLDFRHETGATGRKYLPETMGAGVAVLDYDGDGRMDLYFVQSGPISGPREAAPPNRLYRNLGDGRFEDVTESSGAGSRGYGQGVVAADHDGDGDTDLYVLNFGPNELLENQGDGTFREVGREAGVADGRWGSSAAWFDADGDGDLDLYVVNYLDMSLETHVDCGDVARGRLAYCHPDAYPHSPDVFYRNRGDGTYEDATVESGCTDRDGKGLGVIAGDFDDDGDEDLYVANDSTPNFLLVNDGAGRFEESGLFLGVSHDEEGLTQAGMGVDSGDVDGDGRLDLFVTNLSRESNALYLNDEPAFEYASRTHGLQGPSFPQVGFGTDLGDFDDDGDLDLFVTNGHVIDNIELFDEGLTWRQPGQLFRNDGTGRFAEVGRAECGGPCEERVGRSVAALDYDDDGRLDLVVTENGGPARLFRNEIGEPGRFLGLRLEGRPPNTGAVGARVSIEAAGRGQLRELRAGGSYQAGADPRLHFGLGSAASATVIVRWPDGSSEALGELEAGRYHRVVQGRVTEMTR